VEAENLEVILSLCEVVLPEATIFGLILSLCELVLPEAENTQIYNKFYSTLSPERSMCF
jgi:hypothetical protein